MRSLPALHAHKHPALIQPWAMPLHCGLLLQHQPRHDIHHATALVGDGVEVAAVAQVAGPKVALFHHHHFDAQQAGQNHGLGVMRPRLAKQHNAIDLESGEHVLQKHGPFHQSTSKAHWNTGIAIPLVAATESHPVDQGHAVVFEPMREAVKKWPNRPLQQQHRAALQQSCQRGIARNSL